MNDGSLVAISFDELPVGLSLASPVQSAGELGVRVTAPEARIRSAAGTGYGQGRVTVNGEVGHKGFLPVERKRDAGAAWAKTGGQATQARGFGIRTPARQRTTPWHERPGTMDAVWLGYHDRDTAPGRCTGPMTNGNLSAPMDSHR